jgi:hypothetical protein
MNMNESVTVIVQTIVILLIVSVFAMLAFNYISPLFGGPILSYLQTLVIVFLINMLGNLIRGF